AMAFFIERRAAQRDSTGQETSQSPPISRRRRHGRALLAWSLVAALVAALVTPMHYEITRRRAVLALRSSGATVEIDRGSRNVPSQGWRSWLTPLGIVWQDEVPLYSLESVASISLPPTASAPDLALVARLEEVKSLGA